MPRDRSLRQSVKPCSLARRADPAGDDEIAEPRISPPRGALCAGVDDKGPAKPACLEPAT